MQQGNRFSHNQINKPSYLRKNIKQKVNFFPALKSIDIEEESFINFLSSNQNKLYQYLYEVYSSSIKDELIIDHFFTNKEYSNTNHTKNERIKKFIYETNKTVLTDIDLLEFVKYKHKKDNEFQLMVRYNSVTDSADVYLIDFYHLMIPTEYGQIGERKKDDVRHYERIKNKVGHKYDISSLKSITIDDSTL